MQQALSALTDPSNVLVITYAPAGLGHLRVADALIHGLPDGITPVIMGANSQSISRLHRIMSNPWAVPLMEWWQSGPQEELLTLCYLWYLHSTAGYLKRELLTLLHQHQETPSVLLVVCTYMGLAHQLGIMKDRFAREHGIQVLLVVQVTDDSPQYIWYVEGADLIVVPSHSTRETMLSYAKKHRIRKVQIEVAPYPISQFLQQPLTEGDRRLRQEQLTDESVLPVTVAVPVSGASVGLSYIRDIVGELHERSPRFLFHVVSKNAPHTARFLSELKKLTYVVIHDAPYDRGVVHQYERVYTTEVVSLEITKPSEQAFKALCSPFERGGALLLLTRPVGRQEHDNIYFLMRHGLLPGEEDESALRRMAEHNTPVDLAHDDLMKRAVLWRAMNLPRDPKAAAVFIRWCMAQGIFAAMASEKHRPMPLDAHRDELERNGVTVFWEKVAQLLARNAHRMP